MNKALFVIDMQNDYLYQQRKKKFSYNTAEITAAVNEAIHNYHEDGDDIIYIRHLVQDSAKNRLLFGYSIVGTEGAKLYNGLDIVSDYCFDKFTGDAFTNESLRELISTKCYNEIHLCGIDECGCVAATALGAAKRGINASIISKATATIFPKKAIDYTMKKLEKAGVKHI